MTITISADPVPLHVDARGTIRVARGPQFIGEILLDDKEQVWQHATCIPRDIVLKVLVLYTRRAQTCGKLTGLKDKLDYYWLTADEDEGEAL